MKKYISLIAATAALILAGCTEKAGTEPGNDALPNVVVYQYAPGSEYNPDNDVAIRITANSKVSDLYYIVVPAEDYEAAIEQSGEKAYADYVKANGTKVDAVASEFDGAKVFETIITGIKGKNQIVAAGIAADASAIGSTSFTGLSWTDLASGTFASEALAKRGVGTVAAKLQKCDQIEGRYRFPDLYAPGYHRVFNISGEAQKDADGDTYYNVTCANQPIGLEFGSYGMISARDVATWQGSDDYLQNNYIYPDYNLVVIWTQYNVSAGSLGYGYDVFQPSK